MKKMRDAFLTIMIAFVVSAMLMGCVMSGQFYLNTNSEQGAYLVIGEKK